jgi:hypothetical protein
VNTNFKVNANLSQASIVMGYHGDRFVSSMYYNFMNQSFGNKLFKATSTFHTFGFNIGFRININKNLPWERD